jgi:type II secretory pathway pseudopilin PulG
MTMLAIFMPVAMIWVAATAARASRVMREESQRLQTAIDAIRQAYIAQSQGRDLSNEPSVSRKLDEIAAAARKTETTFTTRRDAASEPSRSTTPSVVATDDQPALALGTTAEDITPPLATEDFIRAMNFPETAEDEVGFAALRRALKDREASQLIQAAQDVLTLLSQDGIYMDDLRPDRARPEIWRQFACGTRGRPVAALGGVRDRSSLVLTSGRMKQDPIFRDAAHHFLRRFDKVFAEFEPCANDSEISALSDTRTARAFMLLGRVAGTFD